MSNYLDQDTVQWQCSIDLTLGQYLITGIQDESFEGFGMVLLQTETLERISLKFYMLVLVIIEGNSCS